jgi:hypothetical protein
MRWGNWYLYDAETVAHTSTGAKVDRASLSTPMNVDAWLLENGAELGLSIGDAVHLHIAANQLEWLAFNYQGLGDWTDEDGIQRGVSAVTVAPPARKGRSRG